MFGIHGYYPHSENLDEFWENLKQGKKLIDLVPPNRWSYEEFYDPDPAAAKNGKIYCKWGGFLNDHDKFDPLFFNISPEEARVMDPQERLFLQSVWAAVEDAGYTRNSLKKHFAKDHGVDRGRELAGNLDADLAGGQRHHALRDRDRRLVEPGSRAALEAPRKPCSASRQIEIRRPIAVPASAIVPGMLSP